jgi:hypothetical protein
MGNSSDIGLSLAAEGLVDELGQGPHLKVRPWLIVLHLFSSLLRSAPRIQSCLLFSPGTAYPQWPLAFLHWRSSTHPRQLLHLRLLFKHE